MFKMTIEILNRFTKDLESAIKIHTKAYKYTGDDYPDFTNHHKLIVNTKQKELDELNKAITILLSVES